MNGDPEQTEILRAIWNEMKALNGRVDKTNEGLSGLRTELRGEMAGLRTELRGEMAELRTELRGEMAELRGEMAELRDEMHAGFEMLGGRIDNLLLGPHGRDHSDLRERVARIEGHLGLPPLPSPPPSTP